MSTPYSISGSLDYPPDDGQPIAKRPFSQSGTFDSKQESEIVLSGSGSHDVDLGTVANIKAILVEVAGSSQAAINIRLNGGTVDMEVSPGGFFAYSNPVPNTGVDQIEITYTADARVLIRVLGDH